MLEPLPKVRPPQREPSPLARGLSPRAAFDWLVLGWRDLRRDPLSSLFFGVVLTAASYAVLGGLAATGLLFLALPAVSGFLIVGPLLAIPLYEKSRRLEQGEPVRLRDMVRVRPASPNQLAYAGLLLGLLLLFWLRVADLLYALFFGLGPIPTAGDSLANVLVTVRGWALLFVGSLLGGLFASFAFAISLFAIPMLMVKRRDALTAMGLSFALTVQNRVPCIAWGTIVAGGMLLSQITGLLALVIVFPVLGHGTWHAWRAIRDGVG